MLPRLNYISEASSFLRKDRLKIPYSIYNISPHNSIRELLGQDAVIKNVLVNDIITDDECYIIDVEYVNIKFNPFEIVFVNVSDIKPIIPNSTTYAVKINGCNVKLNIPNLSEFKTKIPIQINPMINTTAEQQSSSAFTYFGKIVRKPMNSLCTPLKLPGHCVTPFKIKPVEQLYPDGYKLKNSITIDETKEAYKTEIGQFPQLKSVDNIVVAKSFSDCKFGTTGYLIEFEKIPRDHYLNGIILIQSKRIPNIVLYFPTITYTLYLEELESIAEFLKMDEANAYNFDYIMNE